MKDTEILSAFHEGPDHAAARPEAWVFDACHTGVVLRAVLFVELAVAVVVMFGASSLLDWVFRLALATGAALPATLAWLLLGCLAKQLLARLAPLAQYSVAMLLGAASGAAGCGLLALSGLVRPAPWLASAVAGGVLAALLLLGLRLRAKSRTPADTAARLRDLQTRIRPHFLFNTLNSAIALVRAEPARAEALLEDLSDLFRQALRDPGESVALAEEISLARRYLAIERVRFGDRLRVEWALDPAADRVKLPPLLLQPLVENAVRHGVEPSPEGADVRISTQRRGGQVVIKVTNTVPAGPGQGGAGLALRNVEERLSLMHYVHGQFRAGLKDGVFQVRIEVPA